MFGDCITSIEIKEDPKEMVYDLGVKGNHTFMCQSGILSHNTLNSFHYTGQSAKDVSLGVPRLKEVLNASKKPAKPSCTVYIDDKEMLENKGKHETLKKDPNKSEETKKLENKLLRRATEIATDYPETIVEHLLTSYQLRYLPQGKKSLVNDEASPLGLLTYEKYKPSWWVTLYEDLGNAPKCEPDGWVIILEFDRQKMFSLKISTEDIAQAIEDSGNSSHGVGFMACIPSPLNIAMVEVYINFGELAGNEMNFDSNDEDGSLVTSKNVNYFIARDVALSLIKSTVIKGIKGISKSYVRQDEKSGEWLIDTQGTNFPDVLSMQGVDAQRTITDDIWETYKVLGIEAARKVIVREATRILSFDGTYINQRHITLLVDAMCRTGIITSVNRDGISRDVGPLAKGLFEKAVENFAESSAFAERDIMKGVSAAVMMGTVPEVGTGTVEIRDSESLPVERVLPQGAQRVNEAQRVPNKTSIRDTGTKVSKSLRKDTIGTNKKR